MFRLSVLPDSAHSHAPSGLQARSQCAFIKGMKWAWRPSVRQEMSPQRAGRFAYSASACVTWSHSRLSEALRSILSRTCQRIDYDPQLHGHSDLSAGGWSRSAPRLVSRHPGVAISNHRVEVEEL